MPNVGVCCCKPQIEFVVFVIAAITIVFGILNIFGYWLGLGIPVFVGGIIAIVTPGLMMYGVQNGRRGLYWPYMVTNFLSVLGNIVQVVMFSIVLAELYSNDHLENDDGNEMSGEEREVKEIQSIFAIAVASLQIVFGSWFEYVVIRSYRAMGKE
ncbi:unnamed protein product [Bursaphelenchus xylophilus]|uniref:(pine wood nematode) hypothetical protein n=1 Tax=Bursaphelenchus xylophilus TaxID=6326 RepID=A0A1I7SD34_BURXY|nr:unnamed protein product [Bursaphelenchus xylophilus]CAG9093011.1 unnamed protein product [Bursaphelenchus xylophilus]